MEIPYFIDCLKVILSDDLEAEVTVSDENTLIVRFYDGKIRKLKAE